MPTNKQRREAAQRHLQRQLERRVEQAQKRRRNLGIGLAALALVVVIGAALLISGVLGGDDEDTEAAAPDDASTCQYVPADTTVNPDLTDVGVPDGDVPTSGTQALTMTTNYGDIGLTLDQEAAPCAAGAISYLAEQGFFDGTDCHRLTDSPGLQVLQCGDPSGTGRGGAAFDYPTAATGVTETYPRGTIAMANSGQGDDGSQFFLVYGDSLEGNPNYTVVGTIDEPGLGVLDAIAAKGIAEGGQDGAPVEPVTIESMTLAP